MRAKNEVSKQAYQHSMRAFFNQIKMRHKIDQYNVRALDDSVTGLIN